ncbi:MAG: Hint domain-containing protein [Sulfitobacter sp.]
MPRFHPSPPQNMPVYRAESLCVTDGANMGDTLSFADELILDDVYELDAGAEPVRLSLVMADQDQFIVSSETQVGRPGADLHFDSALTFMGYDGTMAEAILLVETDDAGDVEAMYLLPLSHLTAHTEYRLVGIDTQHARQKFAQVACVSFTRGTHITMASGEQRLIETLSPGDRILTRDDGVQELRWVGQSTLRAVGEFAPICIRAGTLNNDSDLIVSPEHRLFIYQRQDRLGAGRSELLIKAKHLVNNSTIFAQEGGFVDYFQLLFESHQIIFAEGIAAETMLVDPRTKPVLPEDLSAALGDVLAGHAKQPHAGLDVDQGLLSRPDAAELLRKASSR